MRNLYRYRPAVWLLSLFVSVCAVGGAGAAEKKSNNRDLYLYQGPDREQRLIENAKKEGTVLFYSTMTVPDAKKFTDAFEKKYGVKVMAWRGGSEKIVQRAITEAQAGRYDVDVIETNGPQMEMLYREKLLEEFYSPALKDIPPNALPKHRHYAPDRFVFFVMAYNTNLVKPQDVPKSYEDILHPKWAGKIGIEATDVVWLAAVTKAMGEEKGLAYFKKLAAMKPDMRTSHILMAKLVAAGEIPLVLTAYNNNVETLKKEGAPVDWKPLPPAFGRASAIGVAKQAPHPHAALLFTEFVLSKEGQEILKSVNRVPASQAVESPLTKFKYELIDPAIVLDEWEKWSKVWSQLFLGGKEVQKDD